MIWAAFFAGSTRCSTLKQPDGAFIYRALYSYSVSTACVYVGIHLQNCATCRFIRWSIIVVEKPHQNKILWEKISCILWPTVKKQLPWTLLTQYRLQALWWYNSTTENVILLVHWVYWFSEWFNDSLVMLLFLKKLCFWTNDSLLKTVAASEYAYFSINKKSVECTRSQYS